MDNTLRVGDFEAAKLRRNRDAVQTPYHKMPWNVAQREQEPSELDAEGTRQ